MKKFFKWALVLLLAVVVLGGALFVNVWYFKPLSLDWYYGRVFAKFALQQPELMTSLRLLDRFGLDFYNDEFSDSSPAAEREQAEYWRREYAVFKRYDREDYQGQRLLSYDVWDYFMGTQVEGMRWMYHNFPVNQMFGVQSGLPNFMAQQHLIDNRGDAEDYITRLELFPIKFGQVIEGLRIREEKGILPPRFTIEKVLSQMHDFIAAPPAENMLYTSFAEKLDKLPAEALGEDDKQTLLSGVSAAIADRVYPAYRELIAYVESIAPQATSNDGVWRLPDGDAYYAYQVRENTTTDMTPDEIHELGLREVARISAEMEAILAAEGLTEGTIGERVQQIAGRADQLYPDSDAGRERILADYQTIIDEVNAAMGDYFDLKPAVGVEVKRVPEFSEKTAPGAYYQPASLDGQRPGAFFANLRDVTEIPRFGMRTLAYHEAIPGHHFQIAITQKLEGLPMFRRLVPFTAYSEGWALYAERLAWEAGFQDEPLNNLGRLQAEMFRAVRLVVDTGMHRRHWTREEAIDYMIAHTGMGDKEVEAEIERYLVNPGQALAYKVGMMKILELREKAKRELGDRFDLKAYHDQVLGNGALPMTLLERVIDEWIVKRQGA